MLDRNRSILGYLVLTAVLASCTTPIKQIELVPTDELAFQSTGKSIIVMPVTVRPRPKLGWTDPTSVPFPEASEYSFAIVSTLSRSGLFTNVVTDGEANYALSTEVIGERLLGGTSNIVFILVRYELVDTETQETIWKDNLFSHHEMSAGEVFLGSDRIAQSCEAAVRNCMEQLDDALAQALDRHLPDYQVTQATMD